MIVTACRSGHRRALAARTLTRAGHDVLNLHGGMNAWARAGPPLSPLKAALPSALVAPFGKYDKCGGDECEEGG